jgi:hypothetical protein
LDVALYQSRYLSDDGRVFFDSSDALVPGDVNGKEDVYEWEVDGLGQNVYEYRGGQVYLISTGKSYRNSYLIGSSENGSDVFFTTAEQLVPQDTDTQRDVWDARVDGGFPAPAPPATVCEGEACQGPAAAPPVFGAPASASISGPGNLTPTPPAKPKPTVLTRAQKLAKALKVCRKDKPKSKREACERSVRRRYGPVKKRK